MVVQSTFPAHSTVFFCLYVYVFNNLNIVNKVTVVYCIGMSFLCYRGDGYYTPY